MCSNFLTKQLKLISGFIYEAFEDCKEYYFRSNQILHPLMYNKSYSIRFSIFLGYLFPTPTIYLG